MPEPRARLPIAILISALAAIPAPPAIRQMVSPAATDSAQPAISLQPILDFRDTDIKFSLRSMMAVLRDRDHEDWVLAAYPDPNTARPLIGAGFSLDVVATQHPQHDPLNPNPFVEPSSDQLWQAAGLEQSQLLQLLDIYNRNLETWGQSLYRKKIRAHKLPAQVTEHQAMQMLRVSAIQAVVNARAYCRDFDRLNGPRQMALSQLVFQMGINLEQFVEFLSELNGDTTHRDLSLPNGGYVTEADHWRNVQATLIDSRWARLYSVRAATVIAMFDPDYTKNPAAAERRIIDILRPPEPRRKGSSSKHRSTKSTHHPSHSKPAK